MLSQAIILYRIFKIVRLASSRYPSLRLIVSLSKFFDDYHSDIPIEINICQRGSHNVTAQSNRRIIPDFSNKRMTLGTITSITGCRKYVMILQIFFYFFNILSEFYKYYITFVKKHSFS